MDIKKRVVFTPSPPINLMCVLILPFHLQLSLQSGFSPPKIITFKNSNELSDNTYIA